MIYVLHLLEKATRVFKRALCRANEWKNFNLHSFPVGVHCQSWYNDIHIASFYHVNGTQPNLYIAHNITNYAKKSAKHLPL